MAYFKINNIFNLVYIVNIVIWTKIVNKIRLEFYIHKYIMNIVVNPESNPELANELTELFSDFVPKAKVVRDNCIAINKELLNELFMNGYTPEIVSGLFLVDSYRNRLDPEDFTQSELVQVRDMFGNLSRQSLEKWVDTLPDQEREQYLLIPHVYLVLDGLILDASAGMFDTEITPDRYLDEDGDRIIK